MNHDLDAEFEENEESGKDFAKNDMERANIDPMVTNSIWMCHTVSHTRRNSEWSQTGSSRVARMLASVVQKMYK